jgi:hypothetical protein
MPLTLAMLLPVAGALCGFCLRAAASSAADGKGAQTPDALRRSAVCSAVSEILKGKAWGSLSLTGLKYDRVPVVNIDYQAVPLSRYRNGGRTILIYGRKCNWNITVAPDLRHFTRAHEA